MTVSIDNYLGVHASAISLRTQRTKLLASNMVNADTPNYKARDIDFNAALKKEIAGHQSTIKQTHSAHIKFSQAFSSSPVMYRVPQEASLDGNTVDTNTEKGKFTENAVRYQASIEFLNKRIRSLIGAIRGE
jgi:flagellar basal-body rod protein FlgB